MPGADSITIASFVDEHDHELIAIATVIAAFVVAELVDRALSRRGKRLGAAVAGGTLSPVATTRLRLVRRLIFAAIVVVGLGLALAQFDSVNRVATGILASSAVLGLVVGFAARQTLANGIAGILLAITQPIRIGDLVTFEDQTGEVEDVQLTYTYIRLDDGRRLIVPNERLAQSSIQNHTVVDARVQVEVSIWVAPDTDLERALALIAAGDNDVEAIVAESDKDGVRLSATTWVASPRERGTVAAELRRRWLRELREHGLSSVEAS
jgi:small-conductance mechanosensitive channel